jgi:peptidoglycan hydrolase-like protein with peptidoglycan-binding domain
VDGSFGAETETAVRSFQETFGLLADGIVGPATWHLLVVPKSE